MEYRKLGNSSLELSVITHGAFAIGGNMWGDNANKDSIESIHASLDHGVTTIDTAPFYGFGLRLVAMSAIDLFKQKIKGSYKTS